MGLIQSINYVKHISILSLFIFTMLDYFHTARQIKVELSRQTTHRQDEPHRGQCQSSIRATGESVEENDVQEETGRVWG